MYTIEVKDFQKQFDKYVKLGQQERIQVTQNGKNIFTIVPEKEKLLNEWELLFGTLPKEATTDKDVNRE